jgi:hypothetical protein
MKRIVNGMAYDTDTSDVIAKAEYDCWADGTVASEGTLYRTPRGAFFEVLEFDTKDEDHKVDHRSQVKFGPLSAAAARKWLSKGQVELIDTSFAEVPDADPFASGHSATIYVRAPVALKRRVEEAAAKAHMTLNAYMCAAAEAYVISGKGLPPRPAYLGAYEPNSRAFPEIAETTEESE